MRPQYPLQQRCDRRAPPSKRATHRRARAALRQAAKRAAFAARLHVERCSGTALQRTPDIEAPEQGLDFSRCSGLYLPSRLSLPASGGAAGSVALTPPVDQAATRAARRRQPYGATRSMRIGGAAAGSDRTGKGAQRKINAKSENNKLGQQIPCVHRSRRKLTRAEVAGTKRSRSHSETISQGNPRAPALTNTGHQQQDRNTQTLNAVPRTE